MEGEPIDRKEGAYEINNNSGEARQVLSHV